MLAFDGVVGDVERRRQRRVDHLRQSAVEGEPSDVRGLVGAVGVDGGAVAGFPFDVVPGALGGAGGDLGRARIWRAVRGSRCGPTGRRRRC